MKWMSQKIQLSEHYETDRERMETSTLGGADAVASFEECGINLQSIIEFKVSFSNKSRENCRHSVLCP
jgi:hypothetical protein